MIQKLKRKITVVVAVILFLVFAAELVTLNVLNYQNARRNACRTASMIAKQFDMFGQSEDWNSPEFVSPEGYYVVFFDRFGTAAAAVSGGDLHLTESELQKYIDLAAENGGKEGIVRDLVFAVSENKMGKILVLTDKTGMEESVRRILLTSLISGAVAAALSFLLARFIARQIVKPVETTFEKQKQFISDAGHELKTPLTVIGANADLLESEIGENKWLNYIRSETGRMNGLVLSLLTLAKLDNAEENQAVFSRFDFSKTAEEMAMTFESVAFENQVQIETEIEPDVQMKGDREQIKQLLSILIDNAIRHSIPGGSVCVGLRTSRQNRIQLSVSNQGEPIPEQERDKIFERFYRSDQARSGSENRFGLGLAIAKSITQRHKGDIRVDCREGVTVFTAVF